jgi:hypothetical protein
MNIRPLRGKTWADLFCCLNFRNPGVSATIDETVRGVRD